MTLYSLSLVFLVCDFIYQSMEIPDVFNDVGKSKIDMKIVFI